MGFNSAFKGLMTAFYVGIVGREEWKQHKTRGHIHEVGNVQEFRFSYSCIRFVKDR